MQRSLVNLQGAAIRSTDGHLGTAYGFSFDNQRLVLRYLTVETAPPSGRRRKALVPVALVASVSFHDAAISLRVRRRTVMGSPRFRPTPSMTRSAEAGLHRYYRCPPYWKTGLAAAREPPPRRGAREAEDREHHLLSTSAVPGCQALIDGRNVGVISDLVFDEETWRITGVVVRLTAREVRGTAFLPAERIAAVADGARTLRFDLSRGHQTADWAVRHRV